MDFALASISVILLKADKLSHFCSLEAESFLWGALVAGWRGFVSELCLDDLFFLRRSEALNLQLLLQIQFWM